LKKESELKLSVEKGSVINVDNYTEFLMLNKMASDLGRVINCGLRIKRNTDLQHWSRFGFNIDSGEADMLLAKLRRDCPALRVNGVHFHMGTNNNDTDFCRKSSEAVCKWAIKAKESGLLEIEYIDMGGGFSSDCPLKSKKDGWKNPSDEE